MATSRNLIMNGVTGTLNKQVVFRRVGDKTIISAYPDMSRRKLSKQQRKVNKLMEEANLYAQTVMASEKKRTEAQIRLDVPRNKLYTSLIKEFFQLNYKKE